MTNRVTLQAKPRTETGKGAARTLRRQGYIPGIIYGHGEETRACQVESKQVEKLLTTGSYESTVIDLKLEDGATSSVLIREVQVHPYRSEVLHIDFLTVRKGEKVKLEVPVRLVGLAPGVKEGGIMEHLRHDVEVRCIPSKIPEALDLEISEMKIGDSVTVADLQVPEDVEVLTDAAATIASVVPPAVIKVEEEVPEEVEVEGVVEEEAEPEVVGRGRPPEEEATEEGQ
ncbi:MAG: 50S ribosomal protein L25/general stress protein Ctc [Gemmatimonadetes bacterium]|nr:50S ribosomal protein L25/general stress protein Ctc [Gemmatimonadota bacterium]NIO30795.1 50S ribosomal protein L25/general stress protein Ctc [Gemmatimonadota bacterium]